MAANLGVKFVADLMEQIGRCHVLLPFCGDILISDKGCATGETRLWVWGVIG